MPWPFVRSVLSWSNGQRGQGMVEYALLVSFIALVAIAILIVLGHQVNNTYSNIGNGVVSQ